MNRTHWAVAGMLLLTAVACSDSNNKSGSTDPSATTPPTFCEAARAANAASDVQQQLFNGGDPPPAVAVQAVVENFGDRFVSMAAVAPADIKADVDIIAQAAQELLTAVRASNYDVTKLAATAEFTSLNSLFSSAEYQAAQNRFQSYIDTNCAVTPPTTGG